MARANTGSFVLPPVTRWQLRLFARYVTYYLRRHFHGFHLLREPDLSGVEDSPILICLNHPGWWDPLLAIYLSQRIFRERTQYAPIAAKGLEKYKIFERFGFFGIDPDTRAGAHRFLQIGRAVLERTDGVLWVTAQGHFTDVRERPVRLMSGVGHLARQALRPFVMLPMALEYTFWEERTPEAFVHFGKAAAVSSGRQASPGDWAERFAQQLEQTQDELSAAVLRRRASEFTPLLTGGSSGVGGVYDLWRAAKAWTRGKRFRPEHGREVS